MYHLRSPIGILASILTSRLLALDKMPDFCSIIRIGDTARCIISKAVLSIAKPDIQHITEYQELYGGQISGIEAAVHATIYSSETVFILQ